MDFSNIPVIFFPPVLNQSTLPGLLQTPENRLRNNCWFNTLNLRNFLSPWHSRTRLSPCAKACSGLDRTFQYKLRVLATPCFVIVNFCGARVPPTHTTADYWFWSSFALLCFAFSSVYFKYWPSNEQHMISSQNLKWRRLKKLEMENTSETDLLIRFDAENTKKKHTDVIGLTHRPILHGGKRIRTVLPSIAMDL